MCTMAVRQVTRWWAKANASASCGLSHVNDVQTGQRLTIDRIDPTHP